MLKPCLTFRVVQWVCKLVTATNRVIDRLRLGYREVRLALATQPACVKLLQEVYFCVLFTSSIWKDFSNFDVAGIFKDVSNKEFRLFTRNFNKICSVVP